MSSNNDPILEIFPLFGFRDLNGVYKIPIDF